MSEVLLNRDGRRWGGDRHRGKHAAAMHAHPVVRRFFSALNEQDTNVREVAQRAGMHADTILGWRRRYVPTVANLTAALNAIGLDLAVVPLGEPDTRRAHRAKETPEDRPPGRVNHRKE